MSSRHENDYIRAKLITFTFFRVPKDKPYEVREVYSRFCAEYENTKPCVTYRCEVRNNRVVKCVVVEGNPELDIFLRNIARCNIEDFVEKHVLMGLMHLRRALEERNLKEQEDSMDSE